MLFLQIFDIVKNSKIDVVKTGLRKTSFLEIPA